jgi:tRNA threonylcarbamoyladenosine biosynthesis protein TsaB
MDRPAILGIDTSTFWLNLALIDLGGHLLCGRHQLVKTHATCLAPAVEELLGTVRLGAPQLSAIGVVLGPGSFTGLRVGLAAAEGYGQALGLPLYGIGSLQALAESVEDEGEGIALLDARRSEVYACRYRREGGRAIPMGEAESLAPAALVGASRKARWAVGDGVALVPSWPEGCVLRQGIPNLAVAAAYRALESLHAGRAGEAVAPLYVRAPDVREPGRV